MSSKHFHELLDKMRKVHDAKNHDYAADGSPFENFDRAAILVEWFKDPIDQVFATLIGIKIARLAELNTSGKTPNNESIDDTYLDGTNYFALWAAYRLAQKEGIIRLADDSGYANPKPPFPYKEICTLCNVDNGDIVRPVIHAMEAHSAVIKHSMQSLKYPTGEFYLLTPQIYKAVLSFLNQKL